MGFVDPFPFTCRPARFRRRLNRFVVEAELGGRTVTAHLHDPGRLTEILTKMSQYKIEPKRIQFVHPYLDKEPTMVLVEGMRGAKPRVKIEPPLIMYSRDGGLRMENGYGHTGG